MPHGFPLRHGVKDGDALLPLLLKFSVEYTTTKATINPGVFSPCTVNDYILLIPTGAHIVLIYIVHHTWLLHVSAGRHPQRAHNQTA